MKVAPDIDVNDLLNQEEPFAWPSDEIEVEALCRVPG